MLEGRRDTECADDATPTGMVSLVEGAARKLGHVDERIVGLDLHGMKDGHGADVIIGCGNGSPEAKELAVRIATHLEAHGHGRS